MKKTLIALALAATGVSSGTYAALTWQTGEINAQAFTLGGTFYSANEFNGKWQWAVGTDLGGFNNKLSDVDSATKKMTITVTKDTPILLGKTQNAFNSPFAGGVGSIPQITFKGNGGTSASITPDASTPGQGTITIPLMQGGSGASSSAIGQATFNVKYAGVSLDGISTTANGPVTVQSLYSSSATGGIFFGGLPTSADKVIGSASNAQALITKFEPTLTQNMLLGQIKAVLTGLTTPTVSLSTTASQENTHHSGSNAVFAAAYALGIGANQHIELTFNTAPTATTEWKAPLTIEVSYN